MGGKREDNRSKATTVASGVVPFLRSPTKKKGGGGEGGREQLLPSFPTPAKIVMGSGPFPFQHPDKALEFRYISHP